MANSMIFGKCVWRRKTCKGGEKMGKCTHKWGKWKEMLWYTPEGRFVGEARRCSKCPAVETRNVKVDSRPAVIQPTIGVFAGIFNKEGKILLKKITSGRFAGEWDLPGGGVDAIRASQTPDERILFEELARHVKEETGISIYSGILNRRILLPAVLKGGGDWAFPIVVGSLDKTPTKGKTRYFSPKEIQELAGGPAGNRLLSGRGKRIYRLITRLLCYSPNPGYADGARLMMTIRNENLLKKLLTIEEGA